MRKLLVRIFNLGFLACALFAALSLCLEPLFRLSVDVVIKKENLQSVLEAAGVGKKEEEETTKSYILRAPENNEDAATDVLSRLTPKYLADNIGDIRPAHPFEVTIPANVCYHPHNQYVVRDIINENIDSITSELANLLSSKLKTVITNVATEVAAEMVTDEITSQIVDLVGDTGELPIKQEDVAEVISEVFELFTENESTPIEDIANTLLGDKDYVLAEPQPTGKISENEKTYFVKVGEEYVKVVAENENSTFDSAKQYYLVSYDGGVLGIVSDLQEAGVEGLEDLDLEELNADMIEEIAVEVLESVPGFTSADYVEATGVTADNFPENNKKYYVLVGDEYVLAESYQDGVTYYEKKVSINNIDAALIGLMEMFLDGNKDENPKEETPVQPSRAATNTTSDLEAEVQNVIKNLIPLDSINAIAEKTVNKYTPLAFTALLGLMLFPWALFGLVTLIRTLRPKKCWTKLWIVFFFAFLELIFGLVLTFGIKFAMPKVIDFAATKLTSPTLKPIVSILRDSTFSIKTGCYVASFVYLGMIVLGIIYGIIAHRVKRDYKLDKRLKVYDKRYGNR